MSNMFRAKEKEIEEVMDMVSDEIKTILGVNFVLAALFYKHKDILIISKNTALAEAINKRRKIVEETYAADGK